MAEKASTLYSLIQPYVVKDIRKILAHVPSVGGGSGGGGIVVTGAPTPHGLSSPHHTGVLLDEQAPQFLLVDGSRQLTGNLSVAAGVTIDGVDISAHAANPSAHHAPVTAGDGIDLSGQQVSVDTDDIVDTNYGLIVVGNDIRINLATNSGLEFASGALRMGTPGDLTYQTTSSRSGASHTHLIETEFDVGTTPKAAILRSTNTGGLTLGSLNTTGEVVVGQSLYAGNNALRVIHHTSPSHHVHVVVNPVAPWSSVDEAFGMEVVDNLRVWGYIVGNLTLQIPDMEPIIAFDGPGPMATDHKGSAIASGGQNAQYVASGKNAIFVPGRFGKAVEITRGGTNLAPNPILGVNATGYAAMGAGTTITRSSLYSMYGTHSLRVETTNATTLGGVNATIGNHTSSTTYTASVWVRRTEASVPLRLVLVEDTTTVLATANVPDAVGWHWVSVTGTTTTTGSLRVYVRKGGSNSPCVFYIDGLDVRSGQSFAMPCGHGDMTTGEGNDAHSWSGTAHNSTTVVSSTGLKYPKEFPIHPVGGQGSVGIWFRAPWLGGSGPGGVAHYMFDCAGTSLTLRYNTSGTITYGAAGATATYNPGNSLDSKWHLGFVTWNDDTNLVKLWIDGAVVATTAYVSEQTVSDMYIGIGSAGSGHFDGWLDHYMAAPRELEQEEMMAIYEADGPAFAHKSIFHMRAGQNRIWFDVEGGWGVTASGRKLFAMYAGDDNNPSATKNWGGVNLSEGDILFGERGLNKGGWMLFDQDWVDGEVGWIYGYGDTPVLTLDKTGAKLVGTLNVVGKITIDSDELVLDEDGLLLRGGSNEVNRIKWLNQLDGNFGIAITGSQIGLGIVESRYVVGGDQYGITTSASGRLYLGAYTSSDAGPEINLLSDDLTAAMRGTNTSAAPTFRVTSDGYAFGPSNTTPSLGSGVGVINIRNRSTAPTSNPSNGGILYAESGAGKWRGSSGTVTTFANAEPHCPVCGADYMKEWDNAEYGYFAICLKCLADELGERPWIVRGPSRLM